MTKFSLADISRFRSEHMGLAMIYIMMFHIWLPKDSMGYGLHRLGNIGVDIFLFLSGMGLWYSWQKDTSLVRYFKRRYKRIYPTWLVMAGLYYITNYKAGWTLWDNGEGIIDLIMDIAINWDFWLHEELTFWFIPTMMMLYTLAPFYMHLIQRSPAYRWIPAMLLCWCLMVQYIPELQQSIGHLEIFWSRMPIFFLGINIADAVMQKRTIEGTAIWGILIAFFASAGTVVYLQQFHTYHYPLFIERMFYIPLTISILLLQGVILHKTPKWFNRAMIFVGGISLEIYLIHESILFAGLMTDIPPYWPRLFVLAAVSIPLSWVLSKVVKSIFH